MVRHFTKHLSNVGATRWLVRGILACGAALALAVGLPAQPASAEIHVGSGCVAWTAAGGCSTIQDYYLDTEQRRYAIGILDVATGSYTITVYNY